MKKFLAYLLLTFLIIGQTQIATLFAQSALEVTQVQDASIQILDTLDTIAQTTLEKIEDTTRNQEIKEKIDVKKVEISEFLAETSQSISESRSTQEIQEELAEARKTVVLKVVSWVTPEGDIESWIPKEILQNTEKKEAAREILQASLSWEGESIRIMMQSKQEQEAVSKLLHTFDETIQILSLYSDGGLNFYELMIHPESIFAREMLWDIEQWILPKAFIGINFIFPEVLLLENTLLEWENLSRTWWVEQYRSFEVFDSLKLQKKIRVWVVDTWVDAGHPDLSARTVSGYDFVNDDTDPDDDQWHGTHVAGTIAASLNSSGIVWVNPYVDIVPLKICSASGFCPSYAIIKSLEYAQRENIDILNMSLWGRGNPVWHPVCAGISAYTRAWGIVIAAAWNSNVDTSTFVPGGCSDALSVAAIDRNNNKAIFSNYGAKVDVAAPWVSVYSTYPRNKGSYRELSGTSMAAPHVAGIVSIIKAHRPTLSSSEVKNILKNAALPVQSETWKSIASGLDTKKLFQILWALSPDEEVQEELWEEEVQETQEKDDITDISSNDISILKSDIEFFEDMYLSEEDIDLYLQNNSQAQYMTWEVIEISSDESQYRELYEKIEINSSEDQLYQEDIYEIKEYQWEESSEFISIHNPDSFDIWDENHTESDLTSNILNLAWSWDTVGVIDYWEEIGVIKEDIIYIEPSDHIEINNFNEITPLIDDSELVIMDSNIDYIEPNYDILPWEQDDEEEDYNWEDDNIWSWEDDTIEINSLPLILNHSSVLNIKKWEDTYLDILSWNWGYSIQVRRPHVMDATLDGNRIILRGKSLWKAWIYVRDASGRRVSLRIYVRYGNLQISQKNYEILRWDSIILQPQEWIVSWSVHNSDIINISWAKISGLKNGITPITLRWYYGEEVVIHAEVKDPEPLIVSHSVLSLENNNSTLIEIQNGNGWYSLTSSTPWIIEFTKIHDTEYRITGKNIWNTQLTIQDRLWRKVVIPVSIAPWPLQLSHTSLDVIVWLSESFSVILWNGNYQVSSNNTHISLHWSAWRYQIVGKKLWESIVEVRDNHGQKATIKVRIIPPYAQTVLSENPIILELWVQKNISIIEGNGFYRLPYWHRYISWGISWDTLTLISNKVSHDYIYIQDRLWKLTPIEVRVVAPKIKVNSENIDIGYYKWFILNIWESWSDKSYTFTSQTWKTQVRFISRFQYEIVWISPWNDTMKVVEYPTWKEVFIKVSVWNPDPFTLSKNEIELENKSQQSIIITSWNGHYSARTRDSNIILFQNSWDITSGYHHKTSHHQEWIIIWRNVWTWFIDFTDTRTWKTQRLKVMVKPIPFTLSKDTLRLYVWDSDNVSVVTWNPKFWISSFNTHFLSVARHSEWNYNIYARHEGKFNLNFFDAAWQIKVLPAEIIKEKPLIVQASMSWNMLFEQPLDINITSWNGQYEVSVENPEVFEVQWSETSWKIIPKKLWASKIYIQDERHRISITKTVQAEKLIVRNTWGMNIHTWNTTWFKILLWNGWYVVYKNNDNISISQWEDENYIVKWEKIGESIILLEDAAGQKWNMKVNIVPRNLAVNQTWIKVLENNSYILEVISWNEWYTLINHNPEIVSVSAQNSHAWTITWLKRWAAKLLVSDKEWKEQIIEVRVSHMDDELETDIRRSVVRLEREWYIQVLNGDGNYTARIIAWDRRIRVHQERQVWLFRIYGRSTWWAIVELSDGRGKAVQIPVSVEAAPALSISHSKLTLPAWSDGMFTLSWWDAPYQVESQDNGSGIHIRQGDYTPIVWGESYYLSYKVLTTKPGTRNYIIQDKAWQSVSLEVIVTSSSTPTPPTTPPTEPTPPPTWDPTPSTPLETELETLIRELLSEFGVQDVGEQGVEINSAPYSATCKLWNTNRFWIRPYDATCVDEQETVAWTCTSWSIDMWKHGVNTCVSQTFYTQMYTPKKDTFRKIDTLLTNIAQKTNNPQALLEKYTDVQNKWVWNQTWNKRELYNYVYDELRNKLYQRLDTQYKRNQDLKYWHREMLMIANNGWWWDGYDVRYAGKQHELEQYALRFSQELESYLFDYSGEYKNWLSSFIQTQTWNTQEILRWTREWVVEGTKDYIMSYYDLANSLLSLDLNSMKSWVKWLWSKVSNPVETLSSAYDGFKDTISWLYEEINAMSWYEKSKWGSYLGTNISLSAADPLGKVVQLSGANFFFKITGKVKTLRVSSILNDIEVKKTLERISKWEGKYDRDGIEFMNREWFLPKKEQWYYTEWTVDTPWLDHRWEKRIVIWKSWEMYFTEDHYRTKEWFTKIN